MFTEFIARKVAIWLDCDGSALEYGWKVWFRVRDTDTWIKYGAAFGTLQQAAECAQAILDSEYNHDRQVK